MSCDTAHRAVNRWQADLACHPRLRSGGWRDVREQRDQRDQREQRSREQREQRAERAERTEIRENRTEIRENREQREQRDRESRGTESREIRGQRDRESRGNKDQINERDFRDVHLPGIANACSRMPSCTPHLWHDASHLDRDVKGRTAPVRRCACRNPESRPGPRERDQGRGIPHAG